MAEVWLEDGVDPVDPSGFVDESSVPMCALDAKGRYAFVNRAMATLNDASIAEHLGRPVDTITPDVAAWTHALIAEVLATGITRTETISHDGRPAFVATMFPMTSVRGTTPYVGVICIPTRVVDEAPTSIWRNRLGFETLLSTTATTLLAASDTDLAPAMRSCLAAIATSQDHVRTSVLRYDAEHALLRFSHSSSDSDVPLAEAIELAMAFDSNGVDASMRYRVPLFLVTRDLPDHASERRDRLAADGIAALYSLPIHFEGTFRGVFVCAQRDATPPSADAAAKLQLLVDLIANALVRANREGALRAAYEEVERLKRAIESERDYLREEIDQELGGSGIVHASEAMAKVLDLAVTVARTTANVLVRGESGSGKEHVARTIHHASERHDRPLVKVNCASIPRELFESEFFGHVRGAFTGALRDRVGRFELANGGTLFLDEIGEIPLAEQAKLLRVIQEGEFERVGDDKTRRVDVRIVAATNRRLERDVAEGRFRRDLYYRLNVFPIEVPPLRERREDILPIAEHYVQVHGARLGRRGRTISEADRRALLDYPWPGNVRELMHVIERSVILSNGGELRIRLPEVATPASTYPASLPTMGAKPARDEKPRAAPVRSVADLRSLEVSMIEQALATSAGRISGRGGAAELLGMSPSTLRDRMKSLGIRRPE